ncbi:MAG TPA: ATP-binding protein [Desulfuromonadaceae bacterium]|jgi:signal transduction histidine kinase
MLGIKYKFALAATLIVALSSLTWGGWIMHNEKKLLLENLNNKGILVVTSFKEIIISSILEEEFGNGEVNGSLDNIIETIVHNNRYGTAYAYVSDPAGTVLAHSNLGEFGKIYDDPLAAEALTKESLQQRFVGDIQDEKAVLDLAMPLNVHGKKWGVLRVGLSLKPLHEQLDYQRGIILSLSLIIFLVEAAVFYLMGLNLAYPLQELAGAMAVVDHSIPNTPLRIKRIDEIGILQKSFRSMLVRLKRSESDRHRAVISLIQSEKLATIGKLVAGVAHEVNTPLAAMVSCIYNLKQVESFKKREELDLLKQACGQIENIVRQLLDFSRAGQLMPEPVKSDLFFREITAMAAMALRNRAVAFETKDLCDPPQILNIDKSKLTQVALDILMNAADASPAGGIIGVKAYIEDEAYCLAIKDNGKGVPPEQQEKIFDLFYTMKASGKGNGIGLAISKNIVDMHCGTILLNSKQDETVFTVVIPINIEKTYELGENSYC